MTGLVQCLECGRHLSIITESHCQYKHGKSLIQYKVDHPGAPTVSEEYSDSLVRAAEDRLTPGVAGKRRAEKQDEELKVARESYQRGQDANP